VDISLRILTARDLGRNTEGLALLNSYLQQRKLKSALLEAIPDVTQL